ncbi:hypothetical protein [Paraburkholderia aspalathi]|uniref:Uncharacterized protein n=1 Tax=Paraburkholderia aspalathi TaxID=1324617 RepID=A0A1I7B664_9BURK|nr:hypothetical protein [Paraburkholderia aspalathi]SFT82710.1 hypothetical protein SAMN05192563_1004214 [Paraburkholderia aspalathi]
MAISNTIVWGAVGAVLPDMIKLVRKRFQDRPTYVRKPWYWLNVVILAGLGVLVVAWRDPADWKDAIAFGAAAPAFFEQIFARDNDEHLGAEERLNVFERIRRWWGS